jgi:hypothetical protein
MAPVNPQTLSPSPPLPVEVVVEAAAVAEPEHSSILRFSAQREENRWFQMQK